MVQLDEGNVIVSLLAKLAQFEVAPADPAHLKYSCDPKLFADTSLGLSRPPQAIDAATAISTRFQEYEQGIIRFFVGVKEIAGQSRSFLLVLLGFGQGRDRQISTALRLYPASAAERDLLLASPARALATIVVRYGVEYEVEGGERTLLEPVVNFNRGRFPVHGAVEIDDLLEALDLEGSNDYSLIVVYQSLQSGGVEAFFPLVLRRNAYEADVRAARNA